MAISTKSVWLETNHRRAVIEATRGMFAHLGSGVSLADELIADRRAEVRAEEAADEARRQQPGES
jgi:hypothetical protein